MLDEGLMSRALGRPAQDAAQSAIDEVMHLAQSASYQSAAQRAALLIETGCQDLRVFVAYGLGLFAERGPATAAASFDAISALLSATALTGNPSLPALRALDTTLRFAFRMMKAQLDFDERQNEAARQLWRQYLAPDSEGSVTRACSDLREAISALIETPLCTDELDAVVTRLDAYCARHARGEPPLRAGAARAPAEDVESSPEPGGRSSPALPREAASFARRASDAQADGGSLAISPALQHFMDKLEAFEHLVANGSLHKASVVADDIRNVIAAFDPIIYLPSLLAPHFRLLSHHVEELAPYWEQGATAGRQALEQLYRVDLDAFVDA